MSTFNRVICTVADAVLGTLAFLGPQGVLVVLSLAAGAIMLLVFRWTSNQHALKRVADRTRADLLAIRLFRDDPAVTLACQLDLLKASGWRLLHSLRPMAVMAVPFILLLIQMARWFEHRPLHPGEAVLVCVKLEPQAWPQDGMIDVRLDAPDGLVVETPALRIPSARQIDHRIRAAAPGDYRLRFTLNGRSFEKRLVVADAFVPLNPTRPGERLLDQLLHPGEPPLPDACGLAAIEVHYPSRSTGFFGLDVHWLITFFALSVLFALLAKPLLRVQI